MTFNIPFQPLLLCVSATLSHTLLQMHHPVPFPHLLRKPSYEGAEMELRL